MFKLNEVESIHWEYENLGSQVGYSWQSMIKFGTMNQNKMYINADTLEVLEIWNDNDDHLIVAPGSLYEFNNIATMEIVNFKNRVWVRNFQKHKHCTQKEVFKSFIKFLIDSIPMEIQVTPSLSNDFLYRTLRELGFESDKIVVSEQTGEFLIVMNKQMV